MKVHDRVVAALVLVDHLRQSGHNNTHTHMGEGMKLKLMVSATGHFLTHFSIRPNKVQFGGTN